MIRRFLVFMVLLALCLSFSACGASGQASEPVPEGFTESQYQTLELYDGDVSVYPLFTSFPKNSNIVYYIFNKMPSKLRLEPGAEHIETEINGKWYEIPPQIYHETPPSNAQVMVFAGEFRSCNISEDLGEYINRAGHYRVIRPLYKEDSVLCCEFYITDDESQFDFMSCLPESPFTLTDGYLGYEVSTKCSLGALGDQQFSYTITNLTDDVLTTGEGVFLEILSDGKWRLTPPDGADAVAYMPEPGKSMGFTAYLRTSWFYVTPADGIITLDWKEDAEFRIVKDVTTADGSRVFCASEPFRLEMAE